MTKRNNRPVRLKWPAITARAAEIVLTYTTTLVTLRQLFYRLVSERTLPNTQAAYERLSEYTAQARRDGWFPNLLDRNRSIEVHFFYDRPARALRGLAQTYRLDRTVGQPVTLMLGVEKTGLVEQLSSWFGDLGIPIAPLGGYCSQSLADQVVELVDQVDRPAVLLYAGDLDASGEDIIRDFVARTGCWESVNRVALDAEQVERYGLSELPGKEDDSCAAGFIERHGHLFQVEVDALDPLLLRDLFQKAINEYWDQEAYDRVLALEQEHREQLLAPGHE
jgi:hypothetical protein